MYYAHFPIIGQEKKLPVYLISMGQHDCQPYLRRGTEFGYPQIFYTTKGAGLLKVDGQSFRIEPGMGYFLPASYPHEYEPTCEVWDNHWLIPGGYGAERMLLELGFDRPLVYSLDSTARLERIFRDMHEALQTDSLYGNFRASGYLYDFLLEYDRARKASPGSSTPNLAVVKCANYLEEHYREQVTMKDLCALTGVSPQHLCRLFRSALNTRPMEYVAKRRIQAAKELLLSTGDPVERIAESVGFGSSVYFCKLFRRYEGMTPTQFRQK